MIAASAFIPVAAILAIKGWAYPDAPYSLMRVLMGLPVLLMFAAKSAREADGMFISDDDFARSGLTRIGNVEVAIALTIMPPIIFSMWGMDKPIAERRVIFEASLVAICVSLIASRAVDRKARRIVAQIAASKAATQEGPIRGG